MKTIALHEVVISIKDKVKELGLSQKEFQKLVFEKTGVWLSDATISRLFAKDSETKGFNFKSTLEPAQRALLGEAVADNSDPHALYEAALLYRDAVIEELNSNIAKIKEEYEKRCDEYRKQNDILVKQLGKKDERMDRKDNIIEKLTKERDELTAKLQRQVPICGKCLAAGEKKMVDEVQAKIDALERDRELLMFANELKK